MYTPLPIESIPLDKFHEAIKNKVTKKIAETLDKRIMRATSSNTTAYNANYPANIASNTASYLPVISKVVTAYEVIRADLEGRFDNYAEVKKNLEDYKELEANFEAYKNCAITLKELYPGDKMEQMIISDCVDFQQRLSELRMARLEIIRRLMN